MADITMIKVYTATCENHNGLKNKYVVIYDNSTKRIYNVDKMCNKHKEFMNTSIMIHIEKNGAVYDKYVQPTEETTENNTHTAEQTEEQPTEEQPTEEQPTTEEQTTTEEMTVHDFNKKRQWGIMRYENGQSWLYDTFVCNEKAIQERVERYNKYSSHGITYTYFDMNA